MRLTQFIGLNNTVTDSCDKANILNNYFSSVFTIECTQSIPFTDKIPYPNIQQIQFNCVDVFQLLASLETHKAPRPDKIPLHLLQIASQEIAPVLTLIFN